MYELVKSTHGKKNLKPMDVTKAMIESSARTTATRSDVKKAIRELIDSGTLTYKYAGGSYVTLPREVRREPPTT